MVHRSPLLVAHRGGNRLAALRDAEALGADVVEADVRLSSPALVDVRHARRLGPLPLLYDEGRLLRAGTPLTLDGLLAAASPRTALLLDLKGRDLRLAERVASLVAPELGRRPLWVCARGWRLLEPFHGEPRLRLLPSVGSPRELESFLRCPGRADGVSIRESLLTEPLVHRLRERADVVVSWTVNRGARAAELADWGVGAITTDDLPAVSAAVPAPLAAAA